MAAFLSAAVAPRPLRLVHRCDQFKMDAVQHGEIADDGGEINGEVGLANRLQIVGVGVIRAAGDTAADGHPPRRRIGKRLHVISAQRDGLLQHPTLVGVHVPVPNAVRRLEAGDFGAVLQRVRDAGIFPAADVVTDDVELQRGEGQRRVVGAVGIAAADIRPPAQRRSPALIICHPHRRRIHRGVDGLRPQRRTRPQAHREQNGHEKTPGRPGENNHCNCSR